MADFPSTTSAYGVWSLNEIRNAIRGSNWPVVAPPALTDEYFANVSLLLHGDGTNGAQNNTFLDSSANSFTITRNGNATQGSFSPYSVSGPYDPSTHGGSGYFDGTGDYLDFGSIDIPTSQDFCAEAWVYLTAYDNAYTEIFAGPSISAGNQNNTQFRVSSTGDIVFAIGGQVPVNVANAWPGLNQWVHVAFVRNSNVCDVYINGQSIGSGTQSAAGRLRYIGETFNGSTPQGYYINGYVSDARIVIGSPVYTSSFTPPTAPLTAVTNTSLLCNFTNAGIFDSTGKNVIETVGNAQIDTTTVKYGTGAMEFDGAGDYLVPPASDEFAFGTGDFTVEAWVYFNAIESATTICCTSTSSSTGNATYQFDVRNGHIAFTYGTSRVEGTTALTTGTWHHVAATRQSGTVKVFLNGTEENSGSVSNDFSDNQLWIAINRGKNVFLNGFLDDLRITKGVARYTANFTPPTAAFLDQ